MHAVFLGYTQIFITLEEGMAFDLVHSRHGSKIHTNIDQTGRIKIAHAYSPYLTGLIGFFQSPVGAVIIAEGLVQEDHVGVVQIQVGKARINSFLCFFVAKILDPELSRDEDFIPGHAGLAHGFTDSPFIEVGCCCIDKAIACLQGCADSLLAFICIGNLKDAETFHRNFYTII